MATSKEKEQICQTEKDSTNVGPHKRFDPPKKPIYKERKTDKAQRRTLLKIHEEIENKPKTLTKGKEKYKPKLLVVKNANNTKPRRRYFFL